LGAAILTPLIFCTPGIVHRERNFFGSVWVKHEKGMASLYHGRINHGQQYLDPKKAEIDVYPYGPPAALVIAFLHSAHGPQPVCIGVIGMGTGSMAVEARRGDTITFYEIDPKIERIARNWFTYLEHSHAKVCVEIGDGRLLLKDSGQMFDAICVDAFNGDAIPVHLLTKEAIEIYLQHLKPDGLLYFHLSNSYLDLAPIIGNLADVLHLKGCQLEYNKAVKYVVVSRDEAKIEALVSFAQKEGVNFSNTTVMALPRRADLRIWTDDYSNLFSIFRWRN
jgi:hypothetical protein